MKLLKAPIIFSLLMAFLCRAAIGQSDLVFEHFSTENGLSHGSVSAVLKDSKGFMWFATWDGINRYDGYSFKTFKPGEADQNPSASNRIESMTIDSLGNLWVTTYDSRAYRLDRYSETFSSIPENPGPDAKVKAIFPLSSGDVWVSTFNNGAYRVVTDQTTKQFSIEHVHALGAVPLPGDEIAFLFEDQSKNIWINTNKGITVLTKDPLACQLKTLLLPENIREKLGHHQITAYHLAASEIFFGTEKGSLLIIEQQGQNVQEISFQNDAPVSTLAGNDQGLVFIGTQGNGLFVFDGRQKRITSHHKETEIKSVLKLYPDSGNRLWIESLNEGISKIDLTTGKYRHYTQALGVNPDLRPTAQCGIMEDENKTVWLTLKGGGFGYYEDQSDEIAYFYNKPGDPESRISNFVNCFYKDPAGVLWLSTYFKGIEKITFYRNKFRFIQPSPLSNLSISNEVRALLEDSKGFLWVATKKQELFLLDREYQTVKKIDKLNGQPIGMVYAMYEDSEGNILLGTKGNGLFRLTRTNGNNFNARHFRHQPDDRFSLSNDNIYSLLEDHQKRIWVGTYGGGLNLMDGDRFYHRGNQLSAYPLEQAPRVRHLAHDRDGNIWAGTTSGFIVFDAQTASPEKISFNHYSPATGNVSGIKSNDIFWILCDRNKRVWMAPLGGGLAMQSKSNYPDRFNFNSLTKKEGLPGDVIFSIIDDEAGNLWMSTENGITFFNPDESIFRNYGHHDGIIQSGFSEASVAKRADGSIVFGANNGLYSFHPSTFGNNQRKVDLVFTGFQLFGKEINPGEKSPLKQSITESKNIRLKHKQNVLTLTWAGLEYNTPGKLQYACMLEGYDEDWQFMGSQNDATYTRIAPGKYEFRVKFVNPELQELNQPQIITINISPPFWKTTWAYMAYGILLLLLAEAARRIISTMIHLRNNIVIEQRLTDIKLSFFTRVSHELRTPLTLIMGPAKEMQQHESLSEKGKVHITLIEHNAQRLLRLVNQLLDFRKIQSNKMELFLYETDLVSFTHQVCRNFEELARTKSINFTVSTPDSAIVVMIDEQKIDSVIYNLLSNAFKFTPVGGTIEVSVRKEAGADKVTIEVCDTGPGIPKELEPSLFTVFSSHQTSGATSGTGIGLALSKELVQLHGGELSYSPVPKGGACFTITLKALGETSKISEYKEVPPSENILKEQKTNTDEKPKKHLYTLLIVEDNDELRNFLRMQLSEEYTVAEAADGKDGLEKAIALQPDIILSDIMMPVMDGIALLDSLKNNFDTSHIPVVLLTARSSVESKIEGLRYGADAYLTKPFNSDQLKAQLMNLLRQRVQLRKYFTQYSESKQITLNTLLTSKDADFLQQVRNIIESNLTNPEFRMEDIHKQVAMGRSKFFDKMKGLTGIAPIEFIREIRLNKAYDLLLSGKCNVTEASYLSGFADAGYFSKSFKEKFGVSPSLLIKNKTENSNP